MKTLIIIFSLICNFLFSQYITGLNLIQNGDGQIKANLKVYLPTVGNFLSSNTTINQNVITLSACYYVTGATIITNLDNDFYIDITNNSNFTLTDKMYSTYNETICNYDQLEDTASLNFTTPIVGTVSLATDENNTKSENISLFPVPTKDVLNIKSNEKIHKVNLYDASGKKLSPLLENNKINTTNLDNGIYFLEIYTGKNTYRRKFTVQK